MNTCPDCKCEFVQPFRCATCGAQKLYDHTVTSQQQTIDALRARVAELEADAARYHWLKADAMDIGLGELILSEEHPRDWDAKIDAHRLPGNKEGSR